MEMSSLRCPDDVLTKKGHRIFAKMWFVCVWISNVLIQNVGDAVLGMDPGSALIHGNVVFALSR